MGKGTSRSHIEKGDCMIPPSRYTEKEFEAIKNAVRVKKLESTDPVYLSHRVKVLGKKGAGKL